MTKMTHWLNAAVLLLASAIGAVAFVAPFFSLVTAPPGVGGALSHAPAFSRLVLWFVGDGETRAKCEALAAELDLGHRVRFFGHVPDPREIYLAADFAVMASDAESLPNFLVEAQLHGLPVVAVDVHGEVQDPSSAGFHLQ